MATRRPIVIGASGKAEEIAQADSLGASAPIFSGTTIIDGPNDIMLAGAASGQSPTIRADGVDANVNLTVQGKGTGYVRIPILDAEGGTIDGTVIGATTPASATFDFMAVGGNAAANARITFNSAAGIFRPLQFQTGGVFRWSVAANSQAETGGNLGSNFAFDAYSDAGAFLFTALFIQRSTGLVTMDRGAAITGGTINNATVGATTPAAVTATTLTANGYTYQSGATGLAGAGTTQATATPITRTYSVFTTVAANSGARLPNLPPVTVGGITTFAEFTVFNAGAAALLLYPATGNTINALAANAALSVAAGARVSGVQHTATNTRLS